MNGRNNEPLFMKLNGGNFFNSGSTAKRNRSTISILDDMFNGNQWAQQQSQQIAQPQQEDKEYDPVPYRQPDISTLKEVSRHSAALPGGLPALDYFYNVKEIEDCKYGTRGDYWGDMVKKGLNSAVGNLANTAKNAYKIARTDPVYGISNVLASTGAPPTAVPMRALHNFYYNKEKIDNINKAADNIKTPWLDSVIKNAENEKENIDSMYSNVEGVKKTAGNVLSGLAEYSPAIITRNPYLAGGYAAVNGYGKASREAELKGKSLTEQNDYGLLNGLIEGVTQAISPGTSGVKSLAENSLKNVLKEAGKVFIKSAAANAGNDIAHGMAEKVYIDPNKPWIGDNGVISPNTAQNAVAMGSIAGLSRLGPLNGRTGSKETNIEGFPTIIQKLKGYLEGSKDKKGRISYNGLNANPFYKGTSGLVNGERYLNVPYSKVSRGIRNTEILTDAQKAQLYEHIKEMGLNPDDFHISPHVSCYSEMCDKALLGPDMFPSTTRTTRSVFETMTPRAATAHEAGHLLTTRNGTAFEAQTLYDEVLASLTGRNLPGLDSVEKYQLLRDAAERARIEQQKLRNIISEVGGK